MRMRIGVDNISPGEATTRAGPGGMRRYLQALLTECSALAPHDQFVLFTPDWAEPLLDNPTPPNVEVAALPGVPVSRTRRIVYQQIALPAAIARHRLDVFLATATVAPLRCPVPVVLAVQFTQFFQWPEAYGWARTAYLRMMLPLSLRKARRAIIFTESARDDLVRWTGVSREKVRVVPHGLAQDLWRRAAAPSIAGRPAVTALTAGRPYLLYVSATYGYKNHTRLIRAFGVLTRRLAIPHVLLLVGGQVTVSFDVLRDEAERAGVGDRVILTGRLEPYDRLVEAYRSADAAVVPTLYETFGFPVLEAMACGCPVVTSHSGSMAELAGDAAVLVDPLDVEALADGMARVLTDTALRERLVARGRERARAFTWQRTAVQTLAVLEEAARP